MILRLEGNARKEYEEEDWHFVIVENLIYWKILLNYYVSNY